MKKYDLTVIYKPNYQKKKIEKKLNQYHIFKSLYNLIKDFQVILFCSEQFLYHRNQVFLLINHTSF